MDKPAPRSAAAEWKSNWTLVLTSAVGFSFFSAVLSLTSLIIEPFSREFGWSRTFVSSGFTISTIITAVMSPVIGLAIDRWGSRRIALPGTITTALAIAAFAFVNGSAAQWIGLWVLYAFASALIKPTVWTAAVVGVFERSRGLALGFTMAGTALSQSLVPPIGNWLITEFGWRAAFVWLGFGWGGFTLILCLLFLFDARDRAVKSQSVKPEAVDLPGLTPREALRDWVIWRLAISNFIVMLMSIGLGIHLFSILTEAGVSRTNAAWLTSLGGVAGIVGKLTTGVLLDRFRPNWIGGLTLGAAAIAFALLIDGVRSPVLIVVAMIVNGYAAGTKTQITGYLAVAYGGMKSFGAIYGAMSAFLALASGLGPLTAGFIYDTTGGYTLFLMLGTAGCLIGGFIIVTLPAYPIWSTARA